MNWYKADLHIHTVLSPCGDLDMSPTRIIKEAKNKNLDIIGITDHNTTLHTALMVELGVKAGITVFPGVEINTREEIHCLAFFENIETTQHFQKYLESSMTGVKNAPDKFGEQLLVNEKEEILDEVDELLIMGIDKSIDEVEQFVHKLNGVFILAHIDRRANSVYSQLGFLPSNLLVDAVEVAFIQNSTSYIQSKPELSHQKVIANSDAHYPQQIGEKQTEYYMSKPVFPEWKKALKNAEHIRIGNIL